MTAIAAWLAALKRRETPTTKPARCADCGSEDSETRYVIERLDGKGPFECDNAFHGGQP